MEFYPKTAPVLPRPKPMQVLVLGLPRTGTTSMCAALKILGFRSYHFNEMSKNNNNKHFQIWLRAVQAKYDGIGERFQGKDFDTILWGYDAVSDDPCCLFVEELLEAYPEAKVILTLRDRESWVLSMRNFILEILKWRAYPFLSYLDHEYTAPYLALLRRTTSILTRGHPPSGYAVHEALLTSFDEHNNKVIKSVPEEKLLVFRPGDGWDPLCKFLEVKVPMGGYPHLNNTSTAMKREHDLFWSRCLRVVQQMSKRVGFPALVLLAALLVVFPSFR